MNRARLPISSGHGVLQTRRRHFIQTGARKRPEAHRPPGTASQHRQERGKPRTAQRARFQHSPSVADKETEEPEGRETSSADPTSVTAGRVAERRASDGAGTPAQGSVSQNKLTAVGGLKSDRTRPRPQRH